jgi:hypothetical protein
MSEQTPADDAPQDDKARFRAALDRKAGRHVDAAGRTPQALHPHTSPAKPQKSFRRKSG